MNDLAQRIRKILPPNMESGIAASEIVAEWIEKQDFYWPKEKRRESAEKLFDDCIAFSDLSDWKKAIDRAFGLEEKSVEEKVSEEIIKDVVGQSAIENWGISSDNQEFLEIGNIARNRMLRLSEKITKLVREHDAKEKK